MCLAIPMEVVKVEGNQAWVELGGVGRWVRVDLLGEVAVGEYVLIHAGLAIERLRPEEAKETLSLLE